MQDAAVIERTSKAFTAATFSKQTVDPAATFKQLLIQVLVYKIFFLAYLLAIITKAIIKCTIKCRVM